ncbi:MAG: hypothetical protein RLZZ502_999 [Pseudomonadota bacterium]|jgi:2-polyprenyl-6-hydroxyphenyl methylase/3-demethylubiquinone-9 3-methyltransferase
MNVEQAELDKFASLASRWWDPNSEFKPLHDINPLRSSYIDAASAVKGKRVLDVGCGGGLLSEALAMLGADTTGIDLGDKALGVAKLHLYESRLKVNYELVSAEDFAQQHPAGFDVVTCMEMLEHVPDPKAIVSACAALLKPAGQVFFSTLSRTPTAYVKAVLGAEYVLNLLPRGTHDYAKMIKPAELAAMARSAGLTVVDIRGMDYSPFTRQARWCQDTSVNYLLRCVK